MEQSEIKKILTKELEEQKKIGFDIGYSLGVSEGTKHGWKMAQCRLLFTEALTEQQVIEIFKTDAATMEEIKDTIKDPMWIINNIDWPSPTVP